MTDSPNCQRWLARGLRAEVWGWRKVAAYKKDGSRSAVDRWDIRIVRLQAPQPRQAAFEHDRGGIMPLAAAGH